MTYALPSNITGFNGMFVYVNSLTNNLFSTLIPVSIYAICFIYLKMGGERTSVSFTAAGVTSFIMSVLLWVVGFVSYQIVFILLVLTALSAWWAYIDGSPN